MLENKRRKRKQKEEGNINKGRMRTKKESNREDTADCEVNQKK
jgi:hypothetical protein